MWRIVNWDKNFENNRSREVKDCKWVAMPNSHDGAGYTELLDHPNGAAHFGAWCAIVQVASKSQPRGELRRSRTLLHDIKTLSRMTRIPVETFTEVVPRLLAINWLEPIAQPVDTQCVSIGSQEGATTSQETALNGMEGNGMERIEDICGERAEPTRPPAPPKQAKVEIVNPETVFYPSFPCLPGAYKRPSVWTLNPELRAELAEAFPGVDIDGEGRKAVAWLKANPAKRKTYDGMRSFLHRWLENSQNRGGGQRQQSFGGKVVDGI